MLGRRAPSGLSRSKASSFSFTEMRVICQCQPIKMLIMLLFELETGDLINSILFLCNVLDYNNTKYGNLIIENILSNIQEVRKYRQR